MFNKLLVILCVVSLIGVSVVKAQEVPKECEEMSIDYQLTIRDLNRTIQGYKDDVKASIKAQKAKADEKIMDKEKSEADEAKRDKSQGK